MKNLYIVSELFYPNKTSTAYIMTEIAKAISVDKKINIVTADIFYDDNIAENLELFNSDLIIHKPIKISNNINSIFNKIKNSIGISLSFVWFLFRKMKRNDTVFAVTNPFLLVFALALLRSFRNFRYVLLVHDVFPENTVPAGLSKENSLAYKFTKYVFDWAYGQADEKVVLGRDMFELVSQKSDNGNIQIIENWFDEDINSNEIVDRNEYLGVNLDNKIVIGFSGNIGRVQNILEFVKIFSTTKNSKLYFVIIGDGSEKNNVVNYLQENNIQNVTYIGSKPRSEQSKFLSCFDIGLITLATGMYGLGVPSKTYNLLAMKKPVFFIGENNSEVDLLIKNNNLGWSYTWNDNKEIHECLNSIEKVPEEFGINALNVASSEYNSTRILNKFKILLND